MTNVVSILKDRQARAAEAERRENLARMHEEARQMRVQELQDEREWQDFWTQLDAELTKGLDRLRQRNWRGGQVKQVSRRHDWLGRPVIEEVAAWPLRVRSWRIIFTSDGEIWHGRADLKRHGLVYMVRGLPRVDQGVQQNIIDRLQRMARKP